MLVDLRFKDLLPKKKLYKNTVGVRTIDDAVSRRLVHVEFVVDRVARGQDFIIDLRLFPVHIIPAVLHTYLFVYHQRSLISTADSVVK
jgi:hypothetical protein